MSVFVLLGMPFRTPILKSQVKNKNKNTPKKYYLLSQPPFQISSDIKEHMLAERENKNYFTSINNDLTIYVCGLQFLISYEFLPE